MSDAFEMTFGIQGQANEDARKKTKPTAASSSSSSSSGKMTAATLPPPAKRTADNDQMDISDDDADDDDEDDADDGDSDDELADEVAAVAADRAATVATDQKFTTADDAAKALMKTNHKYSGADVPAVLVLMAADVETFTLSLPADTAMITKLAGDIALASTAAQFHAMQVHLGGLVGSLLGTTDVIVTLAAREDELQANRTTRPLLKAYDFSFDDELIKAAKAAVDLVAPAVVAGRKCYRKAEKAERKLARSAAKKIEAAKTTVPPPSSTLPPVSSSSSSPPPPVVTLIDLSATNDHTAAGNAMSHGPASIDPSLFTGAALGNMIKTCNAILLGDISLLIAKMNNDAKAVAAANHAEVMKAMAEQLKVTNKVNREQMDALTALIKKDTTLAVTKDVTASVTAALNAKYNFVEKTIVKTGTNNSGSSSSSNSSNSTVTNGSSTVTGKHQREEVVVTKKK